jgi:hypothetical protein
MYHRLNAAAACTFEAAVLSVDRHSENGARKEKEKQLQIHFLHVKRKIKASQ